MLKPFSYKVITINLQLQFPDPEKTSCDEQIKSSKHDCIFK